MDEYTAKPGEICYVESDAEKMWVDIKPILSEGREQLKAMLEAVWKAKAARDREEIEYWKKRHTHIASGSDEMMKQLSEAREARKFLKAEYEKMHDTARLYEKQLAEARAEIERLKSGGERQAIEWYDEVHELKQEIERLKDKVNVLQEPLTAEDISHADLQAEIERLNQYVNSEVIRNGVIWQQNTELKSKLSGFEELQKSYESGVKDHFRLQHEINELKAKLAELEKSLLPLSDHKSDWWWAQVPKDCRPGVTKSIFTIADHIRKAIESQTPSKESDRG